MLNIMSVNTKFMELTPKELIETISDYKVDGFEIASNGIDEFDYLSDLAYQCKINNKHFQIHASSSLDMDTQIAFLKKVENLSDMLGYKINLVFHPQYDEDKLAAVNETIEYMDNIINNVNNDKLQITLENLNDFMDMDRLDKKDITPIICNNEKLYFTYDLGHEIIDGGNVLDTNEAIIPLIKNIHIHTNNKDYSGGYDHKPIMKDDEYWNPIIKAILFLKLHNYNGPVVYEYDVYALPGDNLKEQIINYAKSMEFVGERFGQ